MTRPALEAIRARLWSTNTTASTFADDVAALLAYIEELEEERNDWREAQEATQVKSDFWRSQFRATYTIGETEWAQRIATLEHMLSEERDTVDELRRYIDELKAEATSLGDMLDNAHAREDANWFEVQRLKNRLAKLERVRP